MNIYCSCLRIVLELFYHETGLLTLANMSRILPIHMFYWTVVLSLVAMSFLQRIKKLLQQRVCSGLSPDSLFDMCFEEIETHITKITTMQRYANIPSIIWLNKLFFSFSIEKIYNRWNGICACALCSVKWDMFSNWELCVKFCFKIICILFVCFLSE